MKKNYFERALKVAELTKPKEKEIHAIEFWQKIENVVVAFRITLDDGSKFIVDIYF